MDSQVILRQLLRTPASYRTLFQTSPRPLSRAFTLLSAASYQQRYLSLPRVITPSFWASLIPKPLRKNPLSSSPSPSSELSASEAPPRSRGRNPATPFIILSLLVGSQAIQTLWLKRDREHYMRRAETRVDVLREVIEKVQNGEDVDVEKVLGTGDVVSEKEWKEVLGNIAEEEALFRSKKGRRVLRAAETQEGTKETTIPGQTQDAEGQVGADDGNVKVESYQGAKFY